MTAVRITPAAWRDLDRLVDFLRNDWPETATDTVDLIVDGIDTLARHSLIGREIEHGLRELLISRGRSGYVALYDFDRGEDAVWVLAVRHQRELGYDDSD